jgi:hypothetical protein
MTTKLTEAEVRAIFGDLEERARELEAFSRGARNYSAHQARIEAEYDKKWVAIHEDDVDAANVVAADSPEELRGRLSQEGLPEGECFLCHVTSEKRKLIL